MPRDAACARSPRRTEERKVAVLFNDITERKRAEKALRESEEFNWAVIEGNPDCVKVLDAEGRLLTINASGMRLLELDDFAPLRGEAWEMLWPEERRRPPAAAKRGERPASKASVPRPRGRRNGGM